MPKNFMITQDLEYLDEETIIKGLNEKDSNGFNHLTSYAYILHDKDNAKDGSKRKPHWHILIKMDNNYSFEYIAKRFKVKAQYVEKIKSRFSNALNYLTHNTEEAKKENKFQYEDDEVKSNYEWKCERKKAIDSESKTKRKDEIRNQIIDGTIREFNYTNYISVKEYDEYNKLIKNSFQYRRDKIKGECRDMKVIYIYGGAGFGKTTYAKEYAKKLGYSVYVSSGSNDVLDDYKGQDCLILDDLRPSCLGLSDLLKLLDNHTSSSVKSRFYNKILECKLVIITSHYDIDTFFSLLAKEIKEDIKQLKRRCSTKIKVEQDYMYVSLYDDSKGDYGKEVQIKNNICDKYNKNGFKDDETYNELAMSFELKYDKE